LSHGRYADQQRQRHAARHDFPSCGQIGRRASTIHHATAPRVYSSPVRYRGALQLEKYFRMSARMIGLRIPPTCPAVFMTPPISPVWFPPISMQEPQLAPNMRFEDAAAIAMRIAALTPSCTPAPASIAIPAPTQEITPIPER